MIRNHGVMVLLLLAGAGVTGCDKKSDAAKPDDDEETAETKVAAHGSTKAASAPASAEAKSGDGKAAAGKAKTAKTKSFSKPGRSAVPTLQEWKAVTKEVTVKGSSALNCETKMVREWLRVSCRGKNDSGGTPTRVRVVAGGGPGTFIFASGGVTSLVTPFVDGISLKANFSWTDKSHPLVLAWPHGSPMPNVLGNFEGAKSPLDPPKDRPRRAGVTAKMVDYACNCEWKVLTAGMPAAAGDKPDCRETYVKIDCYHTYSFDCAQYAACARGEPGHGPSCRKGYEPALFNRCVKPCETTSDCEQGQVCEVLVLAGTKACVEKE